MKMRSSFLKIFCLTMVLAFVIANTFSELKLYAQNIYHVSDYVSSMEIEGETDAGLHRPELEYAFLPTTLWTNLGVHLPSGNSLLRADLFQIPGTQLELSFGITYNSIYKHLDIGLGHGWTSDLHAIAQLDEFSNSIIYVSSTGTRLTFPYSSLEGKYLNPTGFAGLAQIFPNGNISITDLDQKTLNFNTDGKLIGLEKCGFGSIEVSYDDQGQPVLMKDPISQRSITLEWSSFGKLLSVKDPIGHTWSFSYDESESYLVGIQQPQLPEFDPVSTNFEYNALGQLIRQITFEGHEIELSYYSQGFASEKLLNWKDPAGNETTFQYEPASQHYFMKTVLTNAEGLSTEYLVGPESKQVETIRQSSSGETIETHYVYDARGWVSQITDPLGNGYHINRNDAGQIISLIYPPAGPGQPSYAREWIYDSPDITGKLLQYREKITPMLWAVTQFVHEDTHWDCLPTKMIDPDGIESHMSYNSQGQLLEVTLDPQNLSQSTEKNYSSNGNLSSIIDPEGNETTFQYNANGQIVMETLFEGHSSLGQVQKIKTIDRHFSGIATSTKDSISGAHMSYSINFDGAAECEYGYEECGKCYLYETENQYPVYIPEYEKPWHDVDLSCPSRSPVMDIPRPPFQPPPVIVKYNATEETHYTYDGTGKVLNTTNPLGQTNSYTYDAFGRLSSVEKYNGQTTQYAYNKLNKIVNKTISGEGSWSYTRDNLGRVVLEQNPIKGQIQYGYSLRGDVLADENGTYSYDIKGRCVSAQYFGGGSDQWVYRSDGALISHNGISYEYNRLGLLTRWSDGLHQAQIQYQSSTGLPLSLMGTGNVSSYNYQFDPRGRLSQITDTSKQIPGFQYQWNNQNQLQSMSLPGQISMQVQYENKIPSAMTLSKGGVQLFSSSSTFSADYLPTEYSFVQAPSFQDSYQFSYDALRRLQSINRSSNQQSVTYNYDENNGKINQISFSDKGDYLIERNSKGQLQSINHPQQIGTESYQYGTDGKLSSIAFPGDRSLSMSWNSHGRISQLQVTENMIQTSFGFSYNAFGKLSSMTKSEQGFASESWHFSYGPKGLEYASQNLYGYPHLSLNFSRDLLGRVLSISYQQSGGFQGEIVPHFDLRGNLVQVTDLSGSLLASFQYDLLHERKINEWNPQGLHLPFKGAKNDFTLELPFTGDNHAITLPNDKNWEIRTDWGMINHEVDIQWEDDEEKKPRYESFLSWDCYCDGWGEGEGKLTEDQRKVIENELRRRGIKNKNKINEIIDEIEADINLCCTSETEDGKGGWKKAENATLVFGTDGYFDWWIRCKLFPEKEE